MGKYAVSHPLLIYYLFTYFAFIALLLLPTLAFSSCISIYRLPLQAGKYVWQTYKQVYDIVMKVGNSIRSCGVEEVMH